MLHEKLRMIRAKRQQVVPHIQNIGLCAKEPGLVELVVEPQRGRKEMEGHLLKLSKRFNAVHSIYKAKRRSSPISYQEMIDIAEDWVATATRLQEKELRKMRKLAIAQDARLNLSKAAPGQLD